MPAACRRHRDGPPVLKHNDERLKAKKKWSHRRRRVGHVKHSLQDVVEGLPGYVALLRSVSIIGNARMRLPVAAKIAFVTAGAIGGTAGSPAPPQRSPPLGIKYTSIFGA